MGKSSEGVLKTHLVSFIVVNYNGGEYLPRCLSSIEKEAFDYECILIDNASIDNTREVIGKFNIISIFNEENKGYPLAINQGIRKAKGKYIFLLSPTTFLEKGSVSKMLEEIKPDDIGIVAPMLIDLEGEIIHSIRSIPTPISFILEGIGASKLFQRVKFIKKWKLPYFNYSKSGEVEQPMSCALLIKKEVFKEIGLFDERFFLYFSDVDFSKRLLGKFKTLYLSTTKVIHKLGGTTALLGPRRIRIRNRDFVSYLKKHHPASLIFLGILIIVVGELHYLCSKLIQSLGMGKK